MTVDEVKKARQYSFAYYFVAILLKMKQSEAKKPLKVGE